jgi:citronellol/citronellal dehydrogenase
MSGGSRGIGLAIGIAAPRLGANVVLLAKTYNPDPRLSGTIHTAAVAIEEGGRDGVGHRGRRARRGVGRQCGAAGVDRFGGIDICVSNASAVFVQHTEVRPIKPFDPMQQIQLRGRFLFTRAALPHLRSWGTRVVAGADCPLWTLCP